MSRSRNSCVRASIRVGYVSPHRTLSSRRIVVCLLYLQYSPLDSLAESSRRITTRALNNRACVRIFRPVRSAESRGKANHSKCLGMSFFLSSLVPRINQRHILVHIRVGENCHLQLQYSKVLPVSGLGLGIHSTVQCNRLLMYFRRVREFRLGNIIIRAINRHVTRN